MSRGNAISFVGITEYEYDYNRGIRVQRQKVQTRPSWLAWTISFFVSCFMYGMATYIIVRHIFNVLHTADALSHVDNYLRKHFGHKNGLDWIFFGPVGVITIVLEMYSLALTFSLMVRQYEAIGKIAATTCWKKLQVGAHFLVSVGALFITYVLYYVCNIYHFLIIQKVLSLSKNGRVAFEVFQNTTTTLTFDTTSINGTTIVYF